MTAPVIAFANNKGGVGKTSLVFHLAWMLAEKGLRVVVADLDPQANQTANFLTEEQLEQLWPAGKNPLTDPGYTVFGSLVPLLRGIGEVGYPHTVTVNDRLQLLPGDLNLSQFEAELSRSWPLCLDGDERSFRVTSAFWWLLSRAGTTHEADVVLVDVGPNLGAINRAALLAADHVVIPLAPDLFSLQGLRNLGPALDTWRKGWHERRSKNPNPDLPLPDGTMRPTGYVLLGHGVRLGRPVQAYQHWMGRIPQVYREHVLVSPADTVPSVDDDPHCLGQLKHYRSLMPMAYEARKPIFALKPADGAFGGHQKAVQDAWRDFSALAQRLLTEVGVTLPTEQQV